jgi:hypothetical protein
MAYSTGRSETKWLSELLAKEAFESQHGRAKSGSGISGAFQSAWRLRISRSLTTIGVKLAPFETGFVSGGKKQNRSFEGVCQWSRRRSRDRIFATVCRCDELHLIFHKHAMETQDPEWSLVGVDLFLPGRRLPSTVDA